MDRPIDIGDRTFAFAMRIVHLCQGSEQQTGVWRTLGKQLLRAGTSIGANVQEAQAGQSRADFIAKYAIALKEARETSYWLRLLKETGSVKLDDLDAIIKEANEISRIIGAIIVSAKGKVKRQKFITKESAKGKGKSS